MATFFQSVRQGFNRSTGRSGNSQQQRTAQNPTSQASASTAPTPVSQSNSSSSNTAISGHDVLGLGQYTPDQNMSRYFFQEKYAGFIVKGNFMTLAALPKNVDLGEWLAHQVVEQYRLLTAMLQCIQEVDTNSNAPLCNPHTCPKMSAGSTHVYTWLDHNRNPVAIPACQYITHVQRWIVGKVKDATIFPTEAPTPNIGTSSYASGGTPSPGTPIASGPSTINAPLSTLSGHDWIGKQNGFPESFFTDCKNIFRQMFRCYAHLYHGHWVDPFWHIDKYKELNTCFVHFITVAKLFRLLSVREMEPMQPLIDIWIKNGNIPSEIASSPSTPTGSTTSHTQQAQVAAQPQVQAQAA